MLSEPETESLLSQIDPLHKEDIQNAEHSSFFFQTARYSLLITRFFTLGEEEIVGYSMPFLIFDDVMYLYDRKAGRFLPMTEGHHSIRRAIEQRLDEDEDLIEHYIDEIDRLEDSLYTRKISPIFLDVWFDLKKDLTRMDRMFDRTKEAVKRYVQRYGETPGFPAEEYVNILEHIGRYQRLADLHTLKLDTLYNYYNSLKNDKINTNIYTLTILSGVFLPLNLIVGFFGMNTQNLFFQEDPSGTKNVVVLLVILLFVLLALFPFVRFIERHILKKLLGRFNLYNNLVDRIRSMTLFKQ